MDGLSALDAHLVAERAQEGVGGGPVAGLDQFGQRRLDFRMVDVNLADLGSSSSSAANFDLRSLRLTADGELLDP